MGEEIKESVKQTSITEDLCEAGSSLWNALTKTQEAQTKAVVGAGQFIAEHPTEAAITVTTGVGGLAAYKVAGQIYEENKEDLAPVVSAVADVGSKMANEVWSNVSSTGSRFAENCRNKPVTTIAEALIFPALPFMHANLSVLKDRLNS